jgi:drug/metabolite transporter (DMT)-like permease
MIPLDYKTPAPPSPEKSMSRVIGRYAAGLAAGLVICTSVERNIGILICGGIYSVLPLVIFYLFVLIRSPLRQPPLEEQSIWLTLICGALTNVIQDFVFNWSQETTNPEGSAAAVTTWVILPMISAWVGFRRR